MLPSCVQFCPSTSGTEATTAQSSASAHSAHISFPVLGSPRRLPLPPTNAQRKALLNPGLPHHAVTPERPPALAQYVGQLVELSFTSDALLACTQCAWNSRLWGTHQYSADSDVFAAIVHAGFLKRACAWPDYQWPDRVVELRTILRIDHTRDPFVGSMRNGVESRCFGGAFHAAAFSIERAWLMWQEVRS